jgi:hypothetical protein
MRRMIAAALLASLLGVAPTLAQTPPPEATSAARELIVAMKATDQFKAILPLIMQNLKPAIVQNRPDVEKDFDAITPAMIDMAMSKLPALTELMAQVYARNFTTAELNDLMAFYKTPTGQKLLQSMPVITQQSLAAGQQFAQTIVTDLQKQIVEEMKKRGHTL